MKFNKIYNVLASSALICTALTTLNTQAALTNYTFGMTTVPDVALVPVTALNFGGKLALTAGTTCSMLVDADLANKPGDVTAKIANAGIADGANYGELAGVGCGNAGTKGTVGVYKITGAAGVEVDITLTPQLAGTNFNFTPSGVAANYEGNSDGDTLVVLSGVAATAVRLAASGDVSGNVGGAGVPAAGESLILLGGLVQVTNTLLAGANYQETFGLDVVYK